MRFRRRAGEDRVPSEDRWRVVMVYGICEFVVYMDDYWLR